MIRKRSGGEGGIVRGCAANPPLRSGPTRARRPKSLRDFVEPGWVRPHTPHPQNKKGPEDRPLFILAERVGFEPTCRNYPTIRFRVGAVMTASVPLRRTPICGAGILAEARDQR